LFTNRHNLSAWPPVLAGLCLSLAIAVYCLARSHPPEFFSPFLATRSELVALTGIFGSAPSFLYTLALGLLIGFCAPRSSAKFHCLAWTGLGMLLPASSQQLVGSYWMRGVFDPADLLATLVGGLLATILIAHTRVESGNAPV